MNNTIEKSAHQSLLTEHLVVLKRLSHLTKELVEILVEKKKFNQYTRNDR